LQLVLKDLAPENKDRLLSLTHHDIPAPNMSVLGWHGQCRSAIGSCEKGHRTIYIWPSSCPLPTTVTRTPNLSTLATIVLTDNWLLLL